MELRCLETYRYGEKARIPAKQAKEMDLDPKDYNGGYVELFEAGKVYDVEPMLARRLLRDYGARRGRKDVRFEPVNSSDLMDLMMGEADKISLAEVLSRGYVVGEDDQVARDKEVEVA